jgi:carbon-monoxide dehydrogenase large subunit
VTYVGQSVPRKEDHRLLTGESSSVDDLVVRGMTWASVVRSPHANAVINGVDVSAALAMPGVIAAFSGTELLDDWAATLPCAWPATPEMNTPPHWPLTPDRARHVGDGVAVVVAETRAAARDAADAVVVDYEPLDAVCDVAIALDPGAPLVHEEFGTNECYDWRLVAGEPDAAFAAAEVTISERYRQQRLIISAMEPRGVLARPTGSGEFTLWSSTQIPHILRTTLARTTGIPEARLRVIAPDVGGGFGAKVQVYAEEALCLGLARRLGRPVKWIAERSEDHLTTHHARDMVQEIELAATAEGRITAVRARLTASMGAYLALNGPGIPLLGATLYNGCYDVEHYDCRVLGVFTHNTKTDAYRGAGRPEAAYAIERSIEALARKVGKDPVEIRRLNFVKQFPHTTAAGNEVDAGDFDACMDKALELLDLEAVRSEQAERRAAGDPRMLGVGFSAYIEMAGLAPSRMLGAGGYGTGGWEAASIRVMPTGTVQMVTGLSPHGQGTATTFAQIVADELGVSPDDVELIHGDTASSSMGLDTYGSRGLVVGGAALYLATQRVIDKARTIAAHQLEAAEEDLSYAAGVFTVRGTAVTASMGEIALAAWKAHDLPDGMEPGLEGSYVFDPTHYNWPSGVYAAVVEVDTETGAVDLRRMVAIDDVGNVINPMIVDGQVHGALAQGIAQALWEEAIYDEAGNLLTSSLMDYLVPTAAELPSFELDRVNTPSTTNPLGAKGAGETGTVGSPPAVVNAALDALAPLGVRHLDMPLTPERIWRAIEEARP